MTDFDSQRGALSAGVQPAVPRPARDRDLRLCRRLAYIRHRTPMVEPSIGPTIVRASSVEDLRAAYRLVHDVFAAAGYIHPTPSRLRLRLFEASPALATFVAKLDGKVVGVMSCLGDTQALGLPSDGAFGPELDELRAGGVRLCEFTNQAVAHEHRDAVLTMNFLRCCVAHMLQAGYDDAIATVSPGRDETYRVLGFREIGAERSYSARLHDPVVSFGLRIGGRGQAQDRRVDARPDGHSMLIEGNPFLEQVADWDLVARRRFLEPRLLRELFVDAGGSIAGSDESQRRALRELWGDALYAEVCSAA